MVLWVQNAIAGKDAIISRRAIGCMKKGKLAGIPFIKEKVKMCGEMRLHRVKFKKRAS